MSYGGYIDACCEVNEKNKCKNCLNYNDYFCNRLKFATDPENSFECFTEKSNKGAVNNS